ncbi:hypothetical protein AYO38_00085 [bacterium SCGC AG-212-C10]|nr:hypothetical protein AYO38_00085 [bacterium SCGC AG-212-C10]
MAPGVEAILDADETLRVGEARNALRQFASESGESGDGGSLVYLAVECFEQNARCTPLFVVCDDLHWADGSSLLFFAALSRLTTRGDRVATRNVLLVMEPELPSLATSSCNPASGRANAIQATIGAKAMISVSNGASDMTACPLPLTRPDEFVPIASLHRLQLFDSEKKKMAQTRQDYVVQGT